jgi:hypothetical protein
VTQHQSRLKGCVSHELIYQRVATSIQSVYCIGEMVMKVCARLKVVSLNRRTVHVHISRDL